MDRCGKKKDRDQRYAKAITAVLNSRTLGKPLNFLGSIPLFVIETVINKYNIKGCSQFSKL